MRIHISHATVYRYELSGVGHGMTRPRGFNQDDSHIFCTGEQLGPELIRLLDFMLRILRAFGITEFEAEWQTRPDKFVGDPADWDKAEAALLESIKAAGIPFVHGEGEGTFYAPKVSVHLRDAIGRRWQLSTIQVDFQTPQRFGISYVGADNQPHQPFMIHRALYGSVERFFAILLEHYAGALPVWLSPVQARILPVRNDHQTYAETVAAVLQNIGVRVDVVAADEPLGSRVRKAKLEKIPYVLVVGDDDVQADTVGVNSREKDRPDRGVPVADFAAALRAEIETHAPAAAQP